MPSFSLVIPDTQVIPQGGGLPNQVSGPTCSPLCPVPHNPLPSDLLENVLCGLAFGLGVLGIVVGLVLIVCFRRPCSGSWPVGQPAGATGGAAWAAGILPGLRGT